MKYVERKEGQTIHDWCLEMAEGDEQVFKLLRKVAVECYSQGAFAAAKSFKKQETRNEKDHVQ